MFYYCVRTLVISFLYTPLLNSNIVVVLHSSTHPMLARDKCVDDLPDDESFVFSNETNYANWFQTKNPPVLLHRNTYFTVSTDKKTCRHSLSLRIRKNTVMRFERCSISFNRNVMCYYVVITSRNIYQSYFKKWYRSRPVCVLSIFIKKNKVKIIRNKSFTQRLTSSLPFDRYYIYILLRLPTHRN